MEKKIRNISVRVSPEFFSEFEKLSQELNLSKKELIIYLFNFYSENKNIKKYENGGNTEGVHNLEYGKYYKFSEIKSLLNLPDNLSVNNFLSNYAKKYKIKKVFLFDKFYLA